MEEKKELSNTPGRRYNSAIRETVKTIYKEVGHMSENRKSLFLGVVAALAMLLLSACALPGKTNPAPAADPPAVSDPTIDSDVSAEAAEALEEDVAKVTEVLAEETDGPEAVAAVEAGIAEIKDSGNIILTIGPETMRELGYEPADVVLVKIGTVELEMPIGTNYTDVDSGEPICLFKTSSSGVDQVVLAANTGNMAAQMGIADKPMDTLTVSVSMVEKQGYAAGYAIHRLGARSSKDRADYPDLSDAEFANFRAVETTGFGRGTLYRSSSPVNPALNRNTEADEAMQLALVRTVMNMADSEETLKGFADYGLTYYSQCNILALNMGMDFFAAKFERKLADGFRWLATHEGPYLIHCKEGKDRTGFASAVLECLMGAKADEIVADYMLTYRNFYGIGPASPQYAEIAAGNIETSLSKAFGIASLGDEGVNLQACAEAYLERIGMTRDEIALLKEKLAADYAGLNTAA